jgi:hypothetical protein
MTPTEVIAEMRERVGTSNYVVPVASVEPWADALEQAMRERDAEIERLREEADQAKLLYRETLARAVTAEVKNERLREDVVHWKGQHGLAHDLSEWHKSDVERLRSAARALLDALDSNPQRVLLEAAITAAGDA